MKTVPNPPPVLNEQQKGRVDELLDDLLDLPPEARRQRVGALHHEDPEVIAEVVSLLQAASSVGDFLTRPAHPNATPDPFGEYFVGTRLGAWRMVARLGRGGMGDVYKATRAEGDFEQTVAVKVLRQEAGAQIERFRAERRILARMEHPGIAHLRDAGTTPDGRPYMVMDYVEGRSIVDYCASTSATLEQRLRLFVAVCEAVAYAHSHLIVHRDLKPSNILVTADGQVKLLDFGIAKLMDSDETPVTQAAHVLLTPQWAAPEQLLGEAVTTAADTYALGLLLFALLTGTDAWARTGGAIAQAMRTVLDKPPPSPSERAAQSNDPPIPPKTLRGDLDAIVAKALRREPSLRYATVQALKEDIERYQRGEPVEARVGARLYTISRTLRRHRWAAAGVVIVILSLAGGLGVAAWQAKHAAIERDIARRDAAREEAVRYSLTRMFGAAITDQGGEKITAKNMIDASAQRVLREYRDQPKLEGQIVITLADLYGALEDVEGAGALLEGFLAQAREAEPAVIADARQKLANIEFLRGHVDKSAELLGQADTFWATAPLRYREERLEGLNTRAKLQRAQGDIDGAVKTSRMAIEQRTALSGRNHRETAVLYNSLAITLMSANRLEEALAAFGNTLEIYRAIGQGDGLDAQIILANIGTLDLRTGRLDEAEKQLKSAFEHEQALAGPSAAVSAAMGYYGRLLSIRARYSEAIEVLKKAADMATQYAGATSPVAMQNRLFLGDAQTAASDFASANKTIDQASADALKQYGPAHLLTLRARLAQANAAIASGGHAAQAMSTLEEIIPRLRKNGLQGGAYLASALESLGLLQLEAGHPDEAIKSLRESVAYRESTGIRNWELAQARERLGEALAASDGRNAEAAKLLQEASELLQSQLGADHPQTRRARVALAKNAEGRR